ncbi:MAG: hypothetical protein KDC19_11645, partial [Saprospiraceae bacterium]|nr:hypothetical protein [Saprospiraceae bacterium]
NCLLAGAAFNLKMRLNQIRSSFWAFLRDMWASLSFEMAAFGFLLANWNQMRSKSQLLHSLDYE